LSGIAFIDSGLDDYQSLVAGVAPGIEVIVLESTQDGVEQISRVLAERHRISRVHIVSHGAPGAIYIGNSELSLETLNHYGNELLSWADWLTPNAEVLIYGCEVAKGDRGQAFIHCLSELTGAAIAAASGAIGNSSRGGTWQLDSYCPNLLFLPVVAFTPELQQSYQSTLSLAPVLYSAATVLEKVPEASGYSLVYSLDIPIDSAFSTSEVPYNVDNSANIGSFDRVAYYLELTNGSDTQWVYVSMDAFTSQVNQVGVPVNSTGAVFQQQVNNMNVFSNVAGVTTGTSITTGNIEFWPYDYNQSSGLAGIGGDGNAYDFNDAYNVAPIGYGSMQVHNYATGQTIFAYNAWGKEFDIDDLGIGNSTGSHPDWTFRANTADYSVRRMHVLVRETAIAPVNDAPTGSATASLEAGAEDTAYSISAASLLEGFSDMDGDTLSVANLIAANGALVNNNNGTYTFTPNANFNGTVNLAYDVVDGKGGSVAATQTVEIAPVNDAPIFAPTGLSPSLPPGSLDPSFGTNGTVVDTTFYNYQAGALLSDGKIIAVGIQNGDFSLVRYNSNGTIDTSFGTNGRTITDFGEPDTNSLRSQDQGWSIAVQPDGKILVAGNSSTYDYNDFRSRPIDQFAVARYNPDGTLDTSFGTDGRVTTDLVSNSSEQGQSVIVQPDGKVIVAGYAGPDFAVVRYNSNGSLDTSFGTDGKVITDINGSDQGQEAILQPDGKILVIGWSSIGGGETIALARYNSDGSLDTSFGTDGKVITSYGPYSDGWDVALQADGKIVIAGRGGGTDPNNYFTINNFAVLRYNSDGSPDTTFGDAGKVTTDFGSYDFAYTVAIQTNGKIVVGGYAYTGASDANFGIVRYNSDGSLDSSFGSSGKVTSSLSNSSDVINDILIQPDGNIVAIGSSFGYSRAAIARYIGDPVLTIPSLPSGTEDTAYTINASNLLTGFTDIDGDTLSVDDLTATNGSLINNNDGTYTFTPSPNFNGTVNLAYNVVDGKGGSVAATQSFAIAPVNDAPVLATNTLSITEGGTVSLSSSNLNTSDPDNTPAQLLYTISNISGGNFSGTGVTTNSNGTVSFSQAAINNGLVQFTHNGGENPPSYAVSVSDGALNTTPVTVTIPAGSFISVNDAPVLATNTLSITEGGTVTLNSSNLNTSDPDNTPAQLLYTISNISGGSFSGTGVTTNSNGTVTFSQAAINNGLVQFTHNGGENPPSYAVSVSDGALNTTPATVAIPAGSFTPVNDAPVLATNTLSITEGGTVTLSSSNLNISDSDNTPAQLIYTISNISGGSFSGTGVTNGNGSVSFTQEAINNGLVQFTHDGGENPPSYAVSVSDGELNTTPATVTIPPGSFISVNDAPVANGDTATTSQNTAVNINVLANDSDIEGNPLSLSLVTNPSNGTVQINNNGTPSILSDDFLTYTPNKGFNGADSFNYTISDGNGGTATATVTVAVGKTSNLLNGTPGNDTLTGSSGQDIINGFAGNDRLDGGNGQDIIDGGAGNDTLLGGKGEDILVGSDGNDWLNGGDNSDTLTGGSGIDTFVIAKKEGNDTITDFSLGQGDLIGLSGGLTFGELTFQGNNILRGTEVLATLTGFNTTTLTQANFIIV
jgi:uncharacterized delta-60 repeat protein